ncbi:MAG: pentapeptide repeat-containing protein, partial [Dolichospermum sp.]
HDSNVYQASMDNINITDAGIYNTGIGIGGEYGTTLPDWD